MTNEERIIRNALGAAKAQTVRFGAGGKAAAKIYREDPVDTEILLGMIAIMANGLAAIDGEA